MGRAIAGVILGYVVMFAAIVVTFTVAYVVLGTEGSFKPQSFEPSLAWILVTFVLGLIAAILGGWVCALLSRGGRAPAVLAVIVLVLGLLMAIPVLMAPAEAPAVRSGDLSNWEAMQQAKQPGWVAVVNPILGAVGVMIGARLRRGGGPSPSPD